MAGSVTELLTQALPLLAIGAGQTLAISLLAILFATLGGVAYGVLAQQGGRLVRGLLRVYLELFRVVPVLVWLYLFFFGLPIFFGLDIPAFWCAVLVLALWGASEVGEVVRGGLGSLARGQQEAGLALGLSTWQLYRHVLLPQALQRLTPPTINIYTRIIKTSSLAVLIGVVEVIKVGQQIIERTYASVLIYGLLFLFFLSVCYPLSLASRRLEQKWGNAV
ncbi:amino acid ABC transporter permease [Aeromonas bestiarum]|jgi:polar amino acid transport system permease protein|uniref:Amino acid ABC transporter permease n=1 Tax=Aeromonas bestiarum TaxID=105751 RepID=A0AAP4JF14_9GAMM|nr:MULTISPECIES: amino acid ABC transporter permease [Aeromonas]ATL97248.1 amino acid ABC transporter permease [Aeromonas sp. CA23]EKP0279392.1 amino acid ABC transporter permease [Aeromonas bestiarum]KFN17549.1 glutamine ABC transporter permease [Aeromonas bestiarum]MCH7349638.1 amino acid ABC transporter permease [Aeromonas sp. MR7]MDM5091187.1 amino acid ABC transporter permease [Aeromonas bestiarum]